MEMVWAEEELDRPLRRRAVRVCGEGAAVRSGRPALLVR